MIRDHDPITISKFAGLYSRGAQDATPLDNASDLLNVKFVQDEVDTRDGFALSLTFATPIVRAYVYKVYGQADRILLLDNTGKIWDSTNLGAPILNIATMTDFGFTNINGRAYLSPHNGLVGLAGEFLYVYSGSGTARKAAGLAPIAASFAALNSGTVGNVEAGFHIFALAYETDTGFITTIGPAVFATVTATGGLSVNLSDIPTGPSGISFVRILASKIIQNYNGNQDGYELFFVPNGRITNGTSTATVSFFDADLLAAGSASYLFDLYDQIPAMLWISTFAGRLIGGGENANPSVVRVSEAGQPEAINQLTGLLTVDPANTSSPVQNGQEYRKQLAIFKKTRTYGFTDNGGDPSTWIEVVLDEGIGTYPHGIATVLDTGGVNVDKIMVISNSGFMMFNGTYFPNDLSWKIKNIWDRINVLYFYKTEVVHDPIGRIVYICVPLDSATEPSHILVMDYSDSPADATEWYLTAKWSIWTLGNSVKPTSLLMEEVSSVPNTLKVASSSNNIYALNPGGTSDFGNAIPTPYYQTGLVPGGDDISLMHFGGSQIRLRGSGILTSTYYSLDSTNSFNGVSLTMATAPGYAPFSLASFSTTKAMLRLGVSSINQYFKINQIKIYVKEVFKQLPL